MSKGDDEEKDNGRREKSRDNQLWINGGLDRKSSTPVTKLNTNTPSQGAGGGGTVALRGRSDTALSHGG
jgi:hypothetical protein